MSQEFWELEEMSQDVRDLEKMCQEVQEPEHRQIMKNLNL